MFAIPMYDTPRRPRRSMGVSSKPSIASLIRTPSAVQDSEPLAASPPPVKTPDQYPMMAKATIQTYIEAYAITSLSTPMHAAPTANTSAAPQLLASPIAVTDRSPSNSSSPIPKSSPSLRRKLPQAKQAVGLDEDMLISQEKGGKEKKGGVAKGFFTALMKRRKSLPFATATASSSPPAVPSTPSTPKNASRTGTPIFSPRQRARETYEVSTPPEDTPSPGSAVSSPVKRGFKSPSQSHLPTKVALSPGYMPPITPPRRQSFASPTRLFQSAPRPFLSPETSPSSSDKRSLYTVSSGPFETSSEFSEGSIGMLREPFDARRMPTRAELQKAKECNVVDQHGESHRFGDLIERSGPTIVCFIRHFWCGLCAVYVSHLATFFTSKDRSATLRRLNLANVKVLVIGNGSHQLIGKYQDLTGSAFHIYTDPTANNGLYKALGMTLRSLDAGTDSEKGEYLADVGMAKNIANSTLSGLKLLGSPGDMKQLGGEFIFTPVGSSPRPSRLPSLVGSPVRPTLSTRPSFATESSVTSAGTMNSTLTHRSEVEVKYVHRMRTTRDHGSVPALFAAVGWIFVKRPRV